MTGLDEHGQKVQQGAQREGIEPIERCNRIAEEFQSMLKQLDISNDDYVRTTEDRHKKVVAQLLQDLYDRGDIYQAEYQGFYSTRAEQFLQEKDKVDGEWPEIFGEVTQITEKNYFFKLGKYQNWLIDHLKANTGFIEPSHRQNQVLEFLKEPLNDLCISRPKERLSWGIPLPFDSEYVTYVWFDALVNYVSAAGFGSESFEKVWPADLHASSERIFWLPSCRLLADYAPGMQLGIAEANPCPWVVDGVWIQNVQEFGGNGGSPEFGRKIRSGCVSLFRDAGNDGGQRCRILLRTI